MNNPKRRNVRWMILPNKAQRVSFQAWNSHQINQIRNLTFSKNGFNDRDDSDVECKRGVWHSCKQSENGNILTFASVARWPLRKHNNSSTAFQG